MEKWEKNRLMQSKAEVKKQDSVIESKTKIIL